MKLRYINISYEICIKDIDKRRHCKHNNLLWLCFDHTVYRDMTKLNKTQKSYVLAKKIFLSFCTNENIFRLRNCLIAFEILGNLITYHHHSNSDLDTDNHDLVQHRLAYIGISCFMTRLLQEFVPYKLVRQRRHLL